MTFTKDPSTHPANGPLTEERLIRVRDELAAAAKRSDGGNLGYMMADAAKAIDELLSVRKAGQDPVIIVGDDGGDALAYRRLIQNFPAGAKLYAAPQLPQPVNDVIASAIGNLRKTLVACNRLNYCGDAVKQLEEACRAAMLQGAEPVRQPNKLREGWVAVPVEPTEDMIIHGFESGPDELFSKEKDWLAYEAMSGCQQAAHRAKLCWAAMIRAAPKP